MISKPRSNTPTNTEYVVLVDLEFHPYGTREEHLNLGLIVSEFIQPFGVFNGKIDLMIGNEIEHIEFTEILGVVETHTSVW